MNTDSLPGSFAEAIGRVETETPTADEAAPEPSMIVRLERALCERDEARAELAAERLRHKLPPDAQPHPAALDPELDLVVAECAKTIKDCTIDRLNRELADQKIWEARAHDRRETAERERDEAREAMDTMTDEMVRLQAMVHNLTAERDQAIRERDRARNERDAAHRRAYPAMRVRTTTATLSVARPSRWDRIVDHAIGICLALAAIVSTVSLVDWVASW